MKSGDCSLSVDFARFADVFEEEADVALLRAEDLSTPGMTL
jgi:hypothetical protein